jgi:hypothetical protein
MSDDANNNTGELIVLFKTIEELLRDEQTIMREYCEEWEAAYVKFDIAQAAIKGDNTALAKFDCADVALAKSEVASSVKKYGSTVVAEVSATAALANALKAAIEKRDRRLFGMTNLSKRAHRFAMASDRKNYGPGATSLPRAN